MADEDRYTTVGKTTTTDIEEDARRAANEDPITGEPGSHPVGTGVGAAGGAVAGAALGGAVGGPVGAMVGAALGGLTGGLAGTGVAEAVNPTEEDAYWRENYRTRPYAGDRPYDDLRPAYQYGWESRTRYADRTWNDVEPDLERDWSTTRGTSNLSWNEARHATRDSWDRVDNLYKATGQSRMTGTAGAAAGTISATSGFGMSPGLSTPGMTSAADPVTNFGAMGTGTGGVAGYSTTPTVGQYDDTYWRQTHTTSPWGRSGRSYEDYEPAYRYGTLSADRYRGSRWEDAEGDLERGWESAKGSSRLAWHEVKDAVRDAWHRVERTVPGDADRDGR
jgi:hypothetical protein